MLTCREQLVFMGRMYDLPRRAATAKADELLAAFGLSEKATGWGGPCRAGCSGA